MTERGNQGLSGLREGLAWAVGSEETRELVCGGPTPPQAHDGCSQALPHVILTTTLRTSVNVPIFQMRNLRV